MISANELRIGNYTSEGKVVSFYENGIHVGFGKCRRFSELEPIELSEEILLKCGFIEYEPYLELKINDNIEFDYYQYICNPKDKFGITTKSQRLSLPIKYLHQLQNLYFALTGQELKIEL